MATTMIIKIMKKQILKYFSYSLLLSVCLMSCNKEEEDITEEPKVEVSDDNSTNDNTDSDSYYFYFNSQSGYNYSANAGSTNISFKCNQKWKITYSGNVSGFSVSPLSGNGSGSIRVKFSDANTKTSGNYITWDEKETIYFHIKIGSKKKAKDTTKEFIIRRHGQKLKV